MYTYSNTKRTLEHKFPGASSASVTLFSAILAGMTTSTATNPIWVVKTRLQLDKSLADRRYINSFDCVSQIWRKEGLRGFTRGLSASYLGVSEGTIQWLMFEQLKRWFGIGRKSPRTLREKMSDVLGAGAIAKFFATTVTYPYEVLSSVL
jgi:solute carrier family 25, member 33/36